MIKLIRYNLLIETTPLKEQTRRPENLVRRSY